MNKGFTINLKAIICFIAISIIWGSTWAVSKLGIEQIPPEVLAYLRNIIAGSIMVFYFFLKGYAFPTVKQLKRFTVLSLLLFTINSLFILYSLKYIPSHVAAVIGCTTPLFIYVIRQIKNSEKINGFFILGCIISIVGVSALISSEMPKERDENFAIGIIISFVAVIAWSIGFCMMENNKDKENIYYSFAWQLLISGIGLYLLSLFSTNSFYLASLSINGWFIVAYLSVFGSVIAFICLAYTIKHLPPNIGSLYVFINPIVAFGISVLLLETQITPVTLVGIILTLIGVWISLTSSSFKQQNSDRKAHEFQGIINFKTVRKEAIKL